MATKHANAEFESLPPVVREALLRCSPQQQRFVMMYCGRAAGNGQLAVKMAGGKGDYGTRASMASQFLREEPVRAAIDAWMTTFAMGASEITARIADMARCSLEPFLAIATGEVDAPAPKQKGKKGKKSKAKTVSAIPRGALIMREQTDESWARHAHWIKSIECDPKTKMITKLVVHDALKASDLMAKILKLYSDAPQVNLFLYLQNLSDEELLHEYEDASREQGLGGMSGVAMTN